MSTTPSVSPSTLKLLIEETLASLVPESDDLAAAARYSLLAPAKRIRPLLLLQAAASFNVDISNALYPACALEMIHTYSLIHDDLPCMDDDDMRRGRPTLHKVYPEGHAVLTGDFLLTYAFEVLGKSPHLSDKQRVELVLSLSKYSGAEGMIGGQATDIAWGSTLYQPQWDALLAMQSKKTAALFAAALEMGAIIANASSEDRQILLAIGYNIGLAFQLIDDIQDGDGAVLLFGNERIKAVAQTLNIQVDDLFDKLSVSCPDLRSLISSIVA